MAKSMLRHEGTHRTRTGDEEGRQVSAAPVAPASSVPVRSGVVIEPSSGRPLTGVTVRWTIGEARQTDSGVELGRATTDENGAFTVALSDDPEVQSEYRRLPCRPEARLWLIADGARPVRDPGSGAAVPIEVPARRGSAPTRAEWRALADELMAQRSLYLESLYGALSLGSIGGLKVGKRAAALAAVSAAVRKTRTHKGVGPAVLERQLDERFHQDFHTSDTIAQPAAKLLNPLLTSVLTTDATHGGFGLAPAAIPPQGAATDDDYLQTLLALTGVHADELRKRFRVSFERAPGEQI